MILTTTFILTYFSRDVAIIITIIAIRFLKNIFEIFPDRNVMPSVMVSQSQWCTGRVDSEVSPDPSEPG